MTNYADFRGGQIAYTIGGQGETQVLIHGYLESKEVWGEFGESLAGRFRVICIDLPGNGESSIFDDNHTMCFLADSVLAVLGKESVEKAFFVGHSLGGYVTLSLADRFPERIKGYVLFHSHPFADTEQVRETRIREIDVVLSGKKDLLHRVNIPRMFADANLVKYADKVEKLKAIAGDHDPEAIVSVISGMMNRKSRVHIVESGRVPMLIILGTMDNYIDYESMKSRIHLPPKGSLVTLDRSGHMGFIEELQKSVTVVTNFTAGISDKVS